MASSDRKPSAVREVRSEPTANEVPVARGPTSARGSVSRGGAPGPTKT
jgi:hypothetical protein